MALKSGVGGGGGGGLMGKTPLYSGSYSSSSSSPSCVVFGLNTSSSSSCCNYCWIGNQQLQLNRCSFFSSRINVNPPPPPPPLIITGGRGRTLSHTTNTSPSPPPDYLPNANFYKVEAILRPWRIPQVSSALLKMGIRGVTVSDVRGFGAQGGLTERQAGSEFSEDKFLAKVKMEIVVSKDQVEAVIDKIIEVARTGEIGDGKIFLVPVTDVIRVRTGERGEKAERMVGGRSDMFSGA